MDASQLPPHLQDLLVAADLCEENGFTEAAEELRKIVDGRVLLMQGREKKQRIEKARIRRQWRLVMDMLQDPFSFLSLPTQDTGPM